MIFLLQGTHCLDAISIIKSLTQRAGPVYMQSTFANIVFADDLLQIISRHNVDFQIYNNVSSYFSTTIKHCR